MAEIINLDKLNYKLEILANLDISKALNKACLVVENEAKRLCPVDTGDLRNSITHEVDDGVGIVGTNKEYAPYVEYGTGILPLKVMDVIHRGVIKTMKGNGILPQDKTAAIP